MIIICDANKLPEEIKAQAHEYVIKRKSKFKIFGVSQYDVECAWLNGFTFCLEGRVDVKVKQCATCVYTDSPCVPSDYSRTAEGGCTHYKNMCEENIKLHAQIEKMKCCANCSFEYPKTEGNSEICRRCRTYSKPFTEWRLDNDRKD